MRTLWKPSDKFIGKYRCIELEEKAWPGSVGWCLAGKDGEIWVDGPGRYKAIIVRSPSGHKLPNELLVRFGMNRLDYYVALCKVPLDPRDQTPFANTFGRY